jgi:hypothetical protein
MRLPTVRRRHRALRSRRAGGYAAAAHWRARFSVENRSKASRMRGDVKGAYSWTTTVALIALPVTLSRQEEQTA